MVETRFYHISALYCCAEFVVSTGGVIITRTRGCSCLFVKLSEKLPNLTNHFASFSVGDGNARYGQRKSAVESDSVTVPGIE